MKKAVLDQRVECAAPKCWLKYTTVFVDKSYYTRVIELDFLTSDSSISLKYFFHICLCHLKSVQISNKNSRVDSLRVLRAGLVPNLAQTHIEALIMFIKLLIMLEVFSGPLVLLN